MRFCYLFISFFLVCCSKDSKFKNDIFKIAINVKDYKTLSDLGFEKEEILIGTLNPTKITHVFLERHDTLISYAFNQNEPEFFFQKKQMDLATVVVTINSKDSIIRIKNEYINTYGDCNEFVLNQRDTFRFFRVSDSKIDIIPKVFLTPASPSM